MVLCVEIARERVCLEEVTSGTKKEKGKKNITKGVFGLKACWAFGFGFGPAEKEKENEKRVRLVLILGSGAHLRCGVHIEVFRESG